MGLLPRKVHIGHPLRSLRCNRSPPTVCKPQGPLVLALSPPYSDERISGRISRPFLRYHAQEHATAEQVPPAIVLGSAFARNVLSFFLP